MKTFTPRTALIAIIAALVALSAGAAESLSVLLQKGIYAEETEGNLDSAIKIYAQITAEAASNRSLVAQAQYRLAVCYQKQDNKQLAVATFNELIRQFPTEAALAQKARDQLVALGQTAPEAVTLRKVALIDNYWFRGVSPNSRMIAYMGHNGQMFMQEPAAGKTWQPFDCNWESQPLGFVFSPDSRRIAYDLYGKGLFVAEADGSNTREVFKPEGKDKIEPWAWTANGKIIAVLRDNNMAAKSLVSIDARTGALEKHNVASFTGTNPGSGELSSNGRFLAIQDRSNLAVVDLETGKRDTLVEGHVAEVNGWARADSELYFRSNRTWAKGSLWMVPMKEGRAAEEPRLVKEARSLSRERIDSVRLPMPRARG